MSHEIIKTPEVREFVLNHLLKNHEGYRAYIVGQSVADMKEMDHYGSYALYDGLNLIGGGFTQSVYITLREHLDRLSKSDLGVLLWKPDSDGSVQRHLEGGYADELDELDDDIRCSECGQILP